MALSRESMATDYPDVALQEGLPEMPPSAPTATASPTATSTATAARRGGLKSVRPAQSFGAPKERQPSRDTYVKLRASGSDQHPEIWYRLVSQEPVGLRFESTSAAYPYALLLGASNDTMHMVDKQDMSKIFGEFRCMQRRDASAGANPFYVVGYFHQEGLQAEGYRAQGAVSLSGSMVGSGAHEMMAKWNDVARDAWRAQQPASSEPTRSAPVDLGVDADGNDIQFGL